ADESGRDALLAVNDILREDESPILADIDVRHGGDVVGVARLNAARDVLATFAEIGRFVLDADVVSGRRPALACFDVRPGGEHARGGGAVGALHRDGGMSDRGHEAQAPGYMWKSGSLPFTARAKAGQAFRRSR